MNISKLHLIIILGAEQVRMFLWAGLRHDDPAVQGAGGGAGLCLLVRLWRELKESCKYYLKTFILSMPLSLSETCRCTGSGAEKASAMFLYEKALNLSAIPLKFNFSCSIC